MASETDGVTVKEMEEIMRAAYEQAYPNVLAASSTLARALRIDILPGGQGRLNIPHYWARFVHDGRGAPFGPQTGRFMIWWRDYREDPRLRGRQTPERVRDLRRLTTAEVKAARKRNKAHLREGGDPSQMPIVFTEEINTPTEGKFFFDNTKGMRGVEGKVQTIIKTQVRIRTESIWKSSRLRGLRGGATLRL
jgi:hypothetical protein